MKNFYEELQKVLFARKPDEKIRVFYNFYESYQKGDFVFEHQTTKIALQEPSYASFVSIVAPQNVPKRKNLTTKEGQKYLLHAIAHIEYSAIDLALDAAYRFENKPKEYYDDWLEVAEDEIRHFLMLQELLEEVGSYYGEVGVHDSLFEAMQRTEHSFIERMAVVPRYLEANGLDATPMILTKLAKLPKNEMLEKIIKALHVIVDEEVSHVKKGDKWFSYACEQNGSDKSIYFSIIEKYYPTWLSKTKSLNIEARRSAGFTCKELSLMSHHEVCEEEK